MLATYPEFTKLSINHKEDIKNLTDKFEPYSDFNFTSLICWNTDGSTEASLLNGNLVIKMPDYTTGESVYSVFGENDIQQTVERLIKDAKRLNLVPEIVVQNLTDTTRLHITEEPDDHDYILDVHKLAHLPGGEFKKKRNKLHAALTELADSLTLDRSPALDEALKPRLRAVFDEWCAHNKQSEQELRWERQAFDNLLTHANSLNLCVTLLSHNGKPVAFSINEVLGGGHAVCHFEKALPIHSNINTLMVHEAAKHLHDLGCRLVNWEQDLGIEGLRRAKLSYQPVGYLKKYSIAAV